MSPRHGAAGRGQKQGMAEKTRSQISLADHVLFLSRSLRRPQAIGAIAPSSRWLARALARQTKPFLPGKVVELGAGTGVVTRALLDAGVTPEDLIVVERDKRLHALLSKRFPNVCVLRADAQALRPALSRRGVGEVAAVVSSLPLVSMPLPTRRAIVSQSFAVLDDDGGFVQYTYGPTSPLPRDLLAELGLQADKVGFVARNLPPATIWRYQRLDDALAKTDRAAAAPGLRAAAG